MSAFPAAERKAFVAHGAAADWRVWKRHVGDYLPILDRLTGTRQTAA